MLRRRREKRRNMLSSGEMVGDVWLRCVEVVSVAARL